MTPRERRIETLLFGRPDKVPLVPGGPRESTLEAWRKQGLPEGRDWWGALLEEIGLEPEKTKPRVDLGVSFRMMPQFEEKVLEHKDGHYIVQDWMGAITEISDEYDYTYIRSAKDFVTRKWHKFPVESRRDWEEMKRRYDSRTPGRIPADLADRCAKARDRDWTLAIHFNGPFWQLREWLGLENLCMMMVEDPAFVEDMIGFWTEFVRATLEPVLRLITPDEVGISEDMAYKAHSMISPAMARRFLMPAYRKWVDDIRQSGCRIVAMDSDGRIDELIPIWIESGINCCNPVEVAAGNDVVDLRRRFGKDMAFWGGVDKRLIAAGGAALKREITRLEPVVRDGGYIPGCDHGVPPDISWKNFVEYSRLLAEVCGWL
ncbi:MAG: hypothetical protein N3A38_04355 [Planctomycetota bacterium]|nr:hypothetical protein [Planctomycetota bacterium]